MANRFLGSYAEILSHRGTGGFVIAGWFGRISRSTTGIATILLVASYTGSYALAGAVSGAIIVGIGVGGPLWSRAMDARGQTAVLPLGLIASVLTSTSLALAVVLGAPHVTWFVLAFLVGLASLDFGTLVRARWASTLERPDHRHTSLALESVNDELTYVIGPPMVTLLAAVAGPLVGFATGIAITIAGGIALLLQPRTAPAVMVREPAHRRGGFIPRGVLLVLPVYAGIGLVFGAIDVSSVAIARQAGAPVLAGIIVACFSIGSVIAGIIFGPISGSWAPRRRVLVTSLAYLVVVPALLLPGSIPALAAVIFAAGLVTTPLLISSTSYIQSSTQSHRLTEALAWPSIGLSIGVTLGATATGLVIDALDGYSGFLVAAGGALVVGISGLVGALVSRPERGV